VRGLRKLHLETRPGSVPVCNPSLVVFSRIPASIYGVRVPNIVAGPAVVSPPSPILSPTVATLPAGSSLAWRALPVHPFSQRAKACRPGARSSPFRALSCGQVTPAEEGWSIEEVKGLLAVLGKAGLKAGRAAPDPRR